MEAAKKAGAGVHAGVKNALEVGHTVMRGLGRGLTIGCAGVGETWRALSTRHITAARISMGVGVIVTSIVVGVGVYFATGGNLVFAIGAGVLVAAVGFARLPSGPMPEYVSRQQAPSPVMMAAVTADDLLPHAVAYLINPQLAAQEAAEEQARQKAEARKQEDETRVRKNLPPKPQEMRDRKKVEEVAIPVEGAPRTMTMSSDAPSLEAEKIDRERREAMVARTRAKTVTLASTRKKQSDASPHAIGAARNVLRKKDEPRAYMPYVPVAPPEPVQMERAGGRKTDVTRSGPPRPISMEG